MKTAQNWLFGLLAAVALASCDGVYIDTNAVASKLHGTWESTGDTSRYSGKLVIDYDSIMITGYDADQTPSVWNGGNDSERPFKDIPKGMPLTCYTEDGKLFIKYQGNVQDFSYEYSTRNGDYFLAFTFGGRPEALKRTGY